MPLRIAKADVGCAVSVCDTGGEASFHGHHHFSARLMGMLSTTLAKRYAKNPKHALHFKREVLVAIDHAQASTLIDHSGNLDYLESGCFYILL